MMRFVAERPNLEGLWLEVDGRSRGAQNFGSLVSYRYRGCLARPNRGASIPLGIKLLQ